MKKEKIGLLKSLNTKERALVLSIFKEPIPLKVEFEAIPK